MSIEIDYSGWGVLLPFGYLVIFSADYGQDITYKAWWWKEAKPYRQVAGYFYKKAKV